MSYQDFLQSTQASQATQSPIEKTSSSSPTSSPARTIPRKPTATYSTMPLHSATGSVHGKVTQFNNLRSTSVSSQGPPTSPAASLSKRSFSPVTGAPPVQIAKYKEGTPALTSPPAPTSTTSLTPVTNGTTEFPTPPAYSEWHTAVKACLALQSDAVQYHNKRPFAALLLGPDRSTTLLSHFSISHFQHAESELARLASLHYPADYLRKCTLVSTWEPCAMCSGTIYWSGIGRVVYAASEAKLRDLTGPNNSENMTMDLPCRVVFGAGQRTIDVVGPVPGWEEKVVEESKKWWKGHQMAVNGGGESPRSLTNGSVKASSIRSNNVVTNPPTAEGVTSRIGDDGEYKADLQVDWMS